MKVRLACQSRKSPVCSDSVNKRFGNSVDFGVPFLRDQGRNPHRLPFLRKRERDIIRPIKFEGKPYKPKVGEMERETCLAAASGRKKEPMQKSSEGVAAASGDSVQGFFCAALAFLIWGLSPVYWKTLSSVPAVEVLPHRIVWSFFSWFPLWYWRKTAASLYRPCEVLESSAS